MSFWDDRYSSADFAYGTEPNDFLVTQAHRLAHGRMLSLAEGEGRNAVFLAKRGLQVHALDQSAVGLRKACHLAERERVFLSTEIVDLGAVELEDSAWDGIVSIFAHMPVDARRHLHAQVVRALKPDGVLVLEAYTPRQLQIDGIGGPGPHQQDLFMSLNVLREELFGLEFLVAHEIERDIEEGRYHSGRSAVVQVVARKPAKD
jgi:SAM-dependent methyltransferase